MSKLCLDASHALYNICEILNAEVCTLNAKIMLNAGMPCILCCQNMNAEVYILDATISMVYMELCYKWTVKFIVYKMPH